MTMVEPVGHEGKYPPPDPDAAAMVPVATEPLHPPEEESKLAVPGSDQRWSNDITRTVTQTTVTSALTVESHAAHAATKKPWYKRLNPLKSQKKIPVPKERVVSREYGASFLSKLTFQWMSPIMKVPSYLRDGGEKPWGEQS